MSTLSLLPPATWPPSSPPTDGRFGTATVSPSGPVIAGELATFTITYTGGWHGIDDGGAIRIAYHTISDCGVPQTTDPASRDYCSVTWAAPAPFRLDYRYDGEYGVRPWKKGILMRVRDASVNEGDTVTITLGDQAHGSPGWRTQTYAGVMRFQVLVDAYATGVWLPVMEPLEIPVVAGPAHHMRAHVPSDVVIGEPFPVTIAIRDKWGNVVAHRQELRRLDTPGVHYLTVDDAVTGLSTESNPVLCHATTPARRICWGDFHAQTEETTGSGTLDEYFTHARDCAAIDFVGHQGNDFQVTEAVWQAIMRKTQQYDAANRFITFAGYEWSGNTPGGGDHNVHFLGGEGQDFDLHRSSHALVQDMSDVATDRFPVTRLYDAFRGRDDVILIPHVGGRYANLREVFDESLMPLVEICSCWGIFEWFAGDAWERGKMFGLSAGSDDHTARPGMSAGPRGHFATGGGLTAVVAPERERQAIWDSVRARRTYASSGPRVLLDVHVNGHSMGEAFTLDSGAIDLEMEVHGTAPLWRVDVFRWPDLVYAHSFAPPVLPAGRHRLRIGWTGSRIRARTRMARWDGTLSINGGRLLSAEGWGFDQPEDGIYEAGAQEVRWRSETAGDWDGIVVDVEAPDSATLTFTSGPKTFSFTPQDVAAGPLVMDAGGVGQLVRVERDPGPDQPRHVTLRWRDERPPAGWHPYFVRVTQQDGHVIWASPVYVTVPE